jgi:hypothetical protein
MKHLSSNLKYNEGHWTEEEEAKVNEFFKKFPQIYENIFLLSGKSCENKKNKIYTHISQYVNTRSADQCRSHI